MSKLPYNVLRHRDWDHAPRDPISIGAAIASAIGVTSTVGVFLITAATYVGISLVTSWAISALAPKPSFGDGTSRGLLVNAKDPISPFDFVYGEVRKGGTVTYYETTGENNKFLHQIIVLAGHEVDSINDIYINDEVVTLDGNGFVTSAPWNSKIRIKKHLGADNQTADADLLAESQQIDSNFRGRGIAYIYVRHEYDQDVFANGLPLVTAVVRGKKVFDPRTSTTVWSNNAALCVRDYIVSKYGLNDTAIDDTAFSAAANISDENVSLDDGGTEKRYTINGVVKAAQSHGDVLQSMMTACAGSLFWGAGNWKLVVGDYVAPAKVLTLDDLRGPISLSTRVNLQDQFNGVQGTFNEAPSAKKPEARWITTDYPPITSSTFEAEDGGEPTMLDLALPFTTSSASAQRLAKLTLFRGREQMTLTADFGLNAFDVEVGEIIAFTNPRYGWDEKEFEVVGWSFGAAEAGDLRVTLTLRETSEAAFDWNAEETDIIANNTNLPNPGTGLVINNLTASGGGRTQGDGTFINSVILDWDDAANAFIDHYEVEWKVKTDSIYSATTSDLSDIEIVPVVDGLLYEFRVRAVTVAGIKGDYATVEFTGGGDQTAPGLPTGITATGGFQYITVSWTNPTDADLNYVEIWEADSNNSGAATRVGISGGNNFQRTNLGLEVTKFYFLKSVDYSGNASAFTTGVSATTTFIDDDDFANGIYSLFTDQGLYAIEDVTSLPVAGDFVGQKVFNRTDGKLYQWTGSAWELVVAQVNAPDINGQLVTAQIAVDAVTNALIANNAVQEENIANLAITAAKVADSAITTAKIANDAVEAGKIATNAVTADKINALAVTEAKVAASAITTAKIADSAVQAAKIATNAVTAVKIAAGSVEAAKINAGAVTAEKISAGAVTAGKIAANAVTATEIAAGSVIADKIATNAVTAVKIAANAVETAKINAGAVNADKIAAGAVTAGKIAANAVTATEISANAVTAEKINADAVTTNKIAASAVTATEIAAGSIITSKIAAGAVTADEIASNSITSAKIVAGTIQANDIATGTITATQIAGSTITGDKIVANTITGGLLATSGIITGSAQINDAVVTNAKIENLAVDTIKVADRAITSQTSVTKASFSTSERTTPVTVLSLSFNGVSGEQVLLGGSFDAKVSGGDGAGEYQFVFNGSVISTFFVGPTSQGRRQSEIASVTPVIGTNTLLLRARRRETNGQAEANNVSLFVLEAFK
jgi:hypothetical protein